MSDDASAALQAAYKECFSGSSGDLVLSDLGRFCRAKEPTWHQDPRVHALLEGRRETFLRIEQLAGTKDPRPFDEVVRAVADPEVVAELESAQAEISELLTRVKLLQDRVAELEADE